MIAEPRRPVELMPEAQIDSLREDFSAICRLSDTDNVVIAIFRAHGKACILAICD
jgi:hypothetical protein